MRTHPRTQALSYYKVFGYPTGLGALLVRKSALHLLAGRRYFGGGTVGVACAEADMYRCTCPRSAASAQNHS